MALPALQAPTHRTGPYGTVLYGQYRVQCQARPHDSELRKAIDQGYCDHRGYQVHTDSFYPEGLEAARYIGCYLGHPPIATSHIVS
jgi:hypothetical protein